MPFTGSHPAAVLPFLRSPLPASALVIGSMAPDFLYYVPRAPGWPTHTPLAVVTVDLALGAAGWALWHGLLAEPALAHAPAALRGRLTGRVRTGLRTRMGSLGAVLRVVAGLVLGAATHVLWDEFTHPRRWATEHIGVLSSVWHGRHGYSWAQDASSVVGAAILLAWCAHWWRRTPDTAGTAAGTGPRWPWGVVALAALAGAATGLSEPDLRSAAVVAAFHGGAAGALTAALLAVVWHARNGTDPAR